MQSGGGHVGVEGGIFDHGDVGDRGAVHQRAFEQIVAQYLIIWQAVGQHGLHRADHQQPFAGEAAFVEQVLVDLGCGGAVGVDPALAGKQAVEAGGLLQRRQGRDDPRLQDAVAAGQRASVGGQAWLVVRVCGHTHQLAQPAGRQLGVAVQRQDVAGVGRDA